MQVRQLLISGLCALAWASQCFAQTLPATSPSTQASAVDIDRLIKQLGDDDTAARDLAQKQLADLGTAADEPLTKAAQNNEDPEIRNRAAAALSAIREHDSNDASVITLHVNQASVSSVLLAIAKQAHAQFASAGPGLVLGVGNKKISLDADHQPFWEVMTQVCQQLNECPMLDSPNRNNLRLFPSSRNWMVESPHQIVGPFWIGVAGIYRARSIDLMGPPAVDDQFTMRVIVYAEPKLVVTQMSDFNVIQAIDDAGNSLIPAPPLSRAAASAAAVLHSSRQMTRTVDSRMNYPQHPGKIIPILRGNVVVTLAEGVQQFKIDDVLATAVTANPLTQCQVKVNVTHVAPDMFQVAVECIREGMNDEQWLAMVNRVSDIILEDSDGHTLTPMNWSNAGFTTTASTFKCTALFSKNIYNGQLLNRQMTGKTGDAKRLIWKIATRLKQVIVPVTFKDLPMP